MNKAQAVVVDSVITATARFSDHNGASLWRFLMKHAIHHGDADIPEPNKVDGMGQEYHYFEFDNGAWVIVETTGKRDINTTAVFDYAWGKSFASVPA